MKGCSFPISDRAAAAAIHHLLVNRQGDRNGHIAAAQRHIFEPITPLQKPFYVIEFIELSIIQSCPAAPVIFLRLKRFYMGAQACEPDEP
jgi:hypothetical protein